MATHSASSTGLQCFTISYKQASTKHHGDARYQARQSVFHYSLQAKPVLHTTFCHSHCSNQTSSPHYILPQSLLKPNKFSTLYSATVIAQPKPFSTLHSASHCSNQTSYPCYILPQSLLKPNKLSVLHSATVTTQTKQVLHTTFSQSLLKPNKFSTLCALTSLRSW